MSDEEAFLHSICENPDDDTSRLVFADWLEENGGASGRARAQFIRIGIEMAKLPPRDPRRNVLMERENRVAAEYFDSWVRQLPRLRGVSWQRFWRGFVSGATVERGKFFRAAETRLFAATPIQFLQFNTLNVECVRSLTASPYLSRLAGLTLIGNGIGNADEVIGVLASCPHLAKLRLLTIAGTLHIPGCFRPTLPGVRISEQGVSALVESRYLAGVQTLNLSGVILHRRDEDTLRRRTKAEVRLTDRVR
jgi:uncharacterized protein (TIGR02996 family)